jgi:hypothetical protein
VVYDVDAKTGALAASTASGASEQWDVTVGMILDPTGRILYVADGGSVHTGDPGGVYRYAVDPVSGGLTSKGSDPRATLGSPPFNWPLSFDPLSHFAYHFDWQSSTIQTFAVDGTTGALTATGTPLATPVLSGLVVDAAGRYLYGDCAGALCAFSLDPISGQPSPVVGSPFGSVTNPFLLETDPSGRFLFGLCGPAVCVYRPDPESGVPEQVPGSQFVDLGLGSPSTIVVTNLSEVANAPATF